MKPIQKTVPERPLDRLLYICEENKKLKQKSGKYTGENIKVISPEFFEDLKFISTELSRHKDNYEWQTGFNHLSAIGYILGKDPEAYVFDSCNETLKAIQLDLQSFQKYVYNQVK